MAEQRVILTDAKTGAYAKVTQTGQLTVAPFDYSEVVFIVLEEPDTAFNFFRPKDKQQFVITSINGKADQDVSVVVDASLVIYEASSFDTTIVDKVLWEDALIRGDRTGLSPLNILVNKGKYVNAKTTDDDIHLIITGFYINEL